MVSGLSKKQKKKLKSAQDLQKLYEDGKLLSAQFYDEMTSQIKNYLMRYLIKKGYYIKGVAQTNFTQEDVEDCYTFVMSHITGTHVTKNKKKSFCKYDPSKGNITSYIHTWSRGYCSSLLTLVRKEHKYSAHIMTQLDDVLVNYTPCNFIMDGVYISVEEEQDRLAFLEKIITEGKRSKIKERFNIVLFSKLNQPDSESSVRRRFY